MKKEPDQNHFGKLEISMILYNQLWRLVHRLESELLKKGVSMHDLDVMRKESFDEKKNEKGGE